MQSLLGVLMHSVELCTTLLLNDTAISDSINMEDFSQMLLNDSFSLFVISDSIDFLLFPSDLFVSCDQRGGGPLPPRRTLIFSVYFFLGSCFFRDVPDAPASEDLPEFL